MMKSKLSRFIIPISIYDLLYILGANQRLPVYGFVSLTFFITTYNMVLPFKKVEIIVLSAPDRRANFFVVVTFERH